MTAKRRPLIERFWAKVQMTPSCWLWAANKNDGGYGKIKVGGQTLFAHRVAYELFNGPIPEGLQLDHLCRVRHCVNPDHLEPVTRRENILRGVGVTAVSARQTHCKSGHEFTLANTGRGKKGSRRCLKCHRLGEVARRQRKSQRQSV